jgi:hypothetical protein
MSTVWELEDVGSVAAVAAVVDELPLDPDAVVADCAV